MSSCYSHTFTIGKGPQTGVTEKRKNHYVIYGLVPVSTSEPQKMANGTKNYKVNTTFTFVDGLLRLITLGIYAPTTTTVTK